MSEQSEVQAAKLAESLVSRNQSTLMIVRVLGIGRNWWAERVPRLELGFIRRGQFGRRSIAERE